MKIRCCSSLKVPENQVSFTEFQDLWDGLNPEAYVGLLYSHACNLFMVSLMKPEHIQWWERKLLRVTYLFGCHFYPFTSKMSGRPLTVMYIHTMEHCSAIKGNDKLIGAPRQIKFKNMLCKRSWRQKTTYCIILFIENVQKRQIHRDREQISGYLGLRMQMGNDFTWTQEILLVWWKYYKIGLWWSLYNLVNLPKNIKLYT